MPVLGWAGLAAMVGLYGVGAVCLRKYSLHHEVVWLLPSFACYLAGNLLFAELMRLQGLGLATLLSAMAQIVLVTLAGQLLFGEPPLTLQQTLGLVLALAAMALVSWPA